MRGKETYFLGGGMGLNIGPKNGDAGALGTDVFDFASLQPCNFLKILSGNKGFAINQNQYASYDL